MAKISGIIITLNEEAHIARAVESLKPWCAEVLVLDSHSTDRTREIAAALGARVLKRDFHSFVDQKNAAVDAAAHDWILAIDADEELAGGFEAGLKTVDFDREDRIYRIRRRSHYLGAWVDWTDWRSDSCTALFNRRRARFGGSRVHASVRGEGCRTKRLPGVIHHWPYRDLEHQLEKLNGYTTHMACELFDRNRRWGRLLLLLDPPWHFFRMFILQGGFLMGIRGFVISGAAAAEE